MAAQWMLPPGSQLVYRGKDAGIISLTAPPVSGGIGSFAQVLDPFLPEEFRSFDAELSRASDGNQRDKASIYLTTPVGLKYWVP